MPRHGGALAALLAVCLLPAPASADLVLFQRERGPAPDGSERLTSEKEISIARDKMRIRDLESGSTVIVRLDRRVVWEIPPEGTEYIEIPFAYLERMKDFPRMSEEEILEAQLDLAGPGEREKARRALEGARGKTAAETPVERALRDSLKAERERLGAKSPEIRWTGRTERIAGFPTREALLTVEGRKVAEVWVTGDRFFRDAFDDYVAAMRSLSLAGGAPPTDLAALGGFPLRTVLFPLERSAREAEAEPLVIEIIQAERRDLSPWDYDIPPGVERAPFLPFEAGAPR